MNLKKCGSKKMVLKIIFIVLLIAILLGIILFISKMYSLKKLEKMSSGDIIDYITKDDDEIKISIAVIKDGENTYQVYGKNSNIPDTTNYDYEILNKIKSITNELKLEDTKAALCTGNLSGYWNWKEDDGYIPAGAIISNIEDMAQYLTFYMNAEDSYISNTYTELKSINANNPTYEKLNIRIDKIGMTWLIDEKNNIIWHNGGTSDFNSYIAFNKNRNIGVVLGNISPNKKVPMTVLGTTLMTELSD